MPPRIHDHSHPYRKHLATNPTWFDTNFVGDLERLDFVQPPDMESDLPTVVIGGQIEGYAKKKIIIVEYELSS